MSQETFAPPPVTLQGILGTYGAGYRSRHPLPYDAHRVLNAVERCHTARMGAHAIRCQSPGCAYEKSAYNSCRNRHCPACQGSQGARWVDKRESELLPVPYFHVCFTLPHELNPLVLANKKALYDALFASAWESMAALIQSRKEFAGQGAALAVLHTWGQNLMDHPHVHMIVPGGALDKGKTAFSQRGVHRKKDGTKTRDFLVPVGPLRILFKNKFLAALAKLYKTQALQFPGSLAALSAGEPFYAMKETLYRKTWVVYCKEPFAGPGQVLAYLGRYTHKTAIANTRLKSMEGGKVTFTLKNYRKEGKREMMVLPVEEFLRRFLLHVLPKGYRRIRMFGFLSSRYKKENLARIRTLLQVAPAAEQLEKKSVVEVVLKAFGVNIQKCPQCGQLSLRIVRLTGPGSG